MSNAKYLNSFVIDLDDTICFPRHDQKEAEEKYGKALPNVSVIDKINELYDAGAYIIIHSARRMLTHDGDIEKIEKDVGDITRRWLSDHGVKYSELIFGKPYASRFYVDDKAMSIKEFVSMK